MRTKLYCVKNVKEYIRNWKTYEYLKETKIDGQIYFAYDIHKLLGKLCIRGEWS